MAEKQQITRVGDGSGNCCGTEDENNLNLNGICTETDRPKCNTGTGEDDDYIYFGGTDADNRAGDGTQRYEGGSKVTLKGGDTFWKLSEQMYGGKHPIEAIYAANGLYPKVTEKDGKIEMTDPTYFAGKTYIMPDPKDIAALEKQYRAKVEELGRSSAKRVGDGEEASQVKLIYGDTFNRMGQAKYGKQVPMEAIYEANGLTGKVTADGCHKDPIYYAGKTYTLPAERDIPELTRKYWERIGHPEKCPPEYRSGGNDNYGNYGETDRDRQPTRPPRPEGDGNYGQYGETDQRDGDGNYGQYGDTGVRRPPCPEGDRQRPRNGDREYDEGYEDGYEDGLRRGRQQGGGCACGGAGCDICLGRQGMTKSSCGCGGAGCENCMGSWQRSEELDEVQRWRGAIEDFTIQQEEQYWREQERQNQRRQNCACGGSGCANCMGGGQGRRRRRQ